MHQCHKFLPILALILLKLKHASNRYVPFMFVSYARAAGLLSPRTYTLTLLQPGDIVCSALTATKVSDILIARYEFKDLSFKCQL